MADINPEFLYNYYSNETGSFGAGDIYDFNTSEYGAGQYLLQPFFQLSSTSNSFPSTSGQLKRFTLQVSRLDYESAGADPELYSDYYNDGYTYSTRLLDLNSNDLYTKYRSAGQWEGNASPDIDQDYGNTAYFNEDTAIHSVKGTPARFRKIPLCTPDGTGYFYALATAPYIVTGFNDGGDAYEKGYLSNWDPDDTQLSINCEENIKVTGRGCLVTVTKEENVFVVSGTSEYLRSINDSNLVSGVTAFWDYCGSGVHLYNITGLGNVSSEIKSIYGKDYIVISGAETEITGTGCFIETFKQGNTVYVSGAPNFYSSINSSNLVSGITNSYNSCGSGINLYNITGSGNISSFYESIDGEDYIVISGQGGGQNVTGTGCFIETFSQDGTTYISGAPNFYSSINQSNLLSGITEGSCGSGINLYSATGRGIVSTEIKELDGKDYLVISGNSDIEPLQITGTGCFIETFKQGDTVYVSGVPKFYSSLNPSNLVSGTTNSYDSCGSGISFYNITGQGVVSSEVKAIDGEDYIVISGQAEGQNVTGTGCLINTFQQGGTIYISGHDNFYSSVNDSNIIDSITENSCGSGINFYGVTGVGVVSSEIKNLDGKDYIYISGQSSTSSAAVTGKNCTESSIEDIGGTDYIAIEFTGQHFSTGNISSSNVWHEITNDAACTNAQNVSLRNVAGVSGVSVTEDGPDLNVGIDCDTLLAECGYYPMTLDICSGGSTIQIQVLGKAL